MPPTHDLPHAIRLATGCLLLATSVNAATAAESAGILQQAAGLPQEFSEHFFEVPLAVRLDLDGRFMGEAMVILTRDEHLQFLEFTDVSDSQETPAVRQYWADYLSDARPLGSCSRSCANGLVALHYSLENSQVSILTQGVERHGEAARYHVQPEHGSRGLIVRNQLNLSGDRRQQAGRYALQAQGSVGHWTTLAEAQADRSTDSFDQTRHRVSQLYGERLHQSHFWRLGYFAPASTGLVRTPRLLGDTPDTTLGMMFGSTDSLLIDTASTSSTPLYVTPSRPGVVELYRDGTLINSQPVQPGLQTLDTRVLPGGIYAVEVRVLEDGHISSSTQEMVYKPVNWSSTDEPWRYNLYIGRQSELLSNWDRDRSGALSAGVLGNYLLHPRAVLGLSAQRADEQMQYGTSLDWEALDRLKLYGNLYHTERRGEGYDLQALLGYSSRLGPGDVVLSQSRAWQYDIDRDASRYWNELDADGRQRYRSRSGQDTQQTSLAVHHRVTHKSSALVRISHSTGYTPGLAVDLGWSSRSQLLGSDADWRLALFDRPGSDSTGHKRNRGINLSLSLNLGQPGKRLSASLGTRTSRDGQVDRNASLGYQQEVELGPLRNVAGTLSVDRYGAGLSGNGQFEHPLAQGDLFAQRSSWDGSVSGGLNLDSSLALGGDQVAVSGQYYGREGGLIVDVESDIEGLRLRADDSQGMASELHAGRNLIPASAWKASSVQLDFADSHDPSAVIQPPLLTYHLNRGGVEHRTVRVMRTVTVLGRLIDAKGDPLKGALVINHAGRGVSEPDGFFSVEMSEQSPVLEVRHGGKRLCYLSLTGEGVQREQDTLLVGDRSCTSKGLAVVLQPPLEEGA
ncbi:TcfC E-set like domain-containing protein [Pseudomonas sp. dw_358]|uniref:TcfC E-set like domain-containing protein n=1 Tax=Pseudomonas sp. dw_358 TaxID=2720083 RepID=UPI001BD1EFFF|nr:TcfC E-set like domain-containing protein [Pseudomonas sp. dw_358]